MIASKRNNKHHEEVTSKHSISMHDTFVDPETGEERNLIDKKNGAERTEAS